MPCPVFVSTERVVQRAGGHLSGAFVFECSPEEHGRHLLALNRGTDYVVNQLLGHFFFGQQQFH